MQMCLRQLSLHRRLCIRRTRAQLSDERPKSCPQALPVSATCNPATPARALPRADSLDASLRSAATAAAGEVAALRGWASAGAPDSEDDGDSPASELRLPRPPLPGAPGSLSCAPVLAW